MKLLLIVTGALSLLVLAAPWVVLIGYMALIIPGLVLSLMPTLFGYLLVTAVLRAILPLSDGPIGTIVAGLLAVCLGWLVAQPARIEAQARFRSAQQPEVTPDGPIKPVGHVRLERSRFMGSDKKGCDALCAALLATPGVASVTLVDVDNESMIARTTYRLAPKGTVAETSLRPSAVSTFRTYDGIDRYKRREADEKALAADWALRLATAETMVAERPLETADLTIAITDRNGRGPRVQRVEVTQGQKVLLRRSLVTSSMLAAPLLLTLEGSMENMHWGWARTALYTGKRYASFKPQDELLAHLTLSPPRVHAQAALQVVTRLKAALDCKGPASDLQLASAWLETFGYKSQAGADSKLVAQILSDPRVQDLQYFFKSNEKDVPATLRAAIVSRFLMPTTSRDDRSRLARLLKNMPEGTFAKLTEDERTILGKYEYRRDAAPFIERLADRGPASLPDLIAILKDSAQIEPWSARRNLVRGARRGLARLGHAAGPALPTVLQLFGDSGGPLTNEWNGSQEWRVAMVRMGLDPARLPWPKSWTETQIAKDRAYIEDMVERHDAVWENGYNY